MSPSKLTLVCFAVKEEAKPFIRFTESRSDIRTLITGMGLRNAEKSLRSALAQTEPGLVLTCGFTGGLNPGLLPGTVLFEAGADPELATALTSAGAQVARFYCATRVATTVGEKRALRERTGADAVEMESQFLRAICQECGITSATVRVILDSADEDLPLDFNQLMNQEHEIDGWKLTKALLGCPNKVPALIRFQKQTQAAAERLAVVLQAVLIAISTKSARLV